MTVSMADKELYFGMIAVLRQRPMQERVFKMLIAKGYVVHTPWVKPTDEGLVHFAKVELTPEGRMRMKELTPHIDAKGEIAAGEVRH